MRNLVRGFATLALAALPLEAVEFSGQAGLIWADNLSRTSFGPDQQSAAVFSGTVSAAQSRQLAPSLLLLVSADVCVEQVPSFTALDQLHAGLRVQLHRKFGLGPFAPVLETGVAITRANFRESGRSGWRTEASLGLRQRLTETLRVAAHGRWEEFAAAHRPFDLRSRRLALELNWDAAERWQLVGGASRFWGQLTANASENIYYRALAGSFGPRIGVYYHSIPWEESGTFGPGWVAYRVDCSADFWWLGATFALSAKTSLPFRYEAVKVVNRAAVRYDSAFWSLSVVRRF